MVPSHTAGIRHCRKVQEKSTRSKWKSYKQCWCPPPKVPGTFRHCFQWLGKVKEHAESARTKTNSLNCRGNIRRTGWWVGVEWIQQTCGVAVSNTSPFLLCLLIALSFVTLSPVHVATIVYWLVVINCLQFLQGEVNGSLTGQWQAYISSRKCTGFQKKSST